jgi:hypothetical protein
LGFGDVSSSSDVGALREPGLSFSRAFLSDMMQVWNPDYRADKDRRRVVRGSRRWGV